MNKRLRLQRFLHSPDGRTDVPTSQELETLGKKVLHIVKRQEQPRPLWHVNWVGALALTTVLLVAIMPFVWTSWQNDTFQIRSLNRAPMLWMRAFCIENKVVRELFAHNNITTGQPPTLLRATCPRSGEISVSVSNTGDTPMWFRIDLIQDRHSATIWPTERNKLQNIAPGVRDQLLTKSIALNEFVPGQAAIVARFSSREDFLTLDTTAGVATSIKSFSIPITIVR